MKLQELESDHLQVGQRIAVSTPFDARLWVKAGDGGFVLSPMSGFGTSDSQAWAEVTWIKLPYAWLLVDVDDEGTQAIRVYVDTRTLRLWRAQSPPVRRVDLAWWGGGRRPCGRWRR